MKQIDEYVIIDTHVHLYRTVRQGWQGRAAGDRVDAGGDVDQLLRCMDEAGISGAWIINAWPTVQMLQGLKSKLPPSLREEQEERVKQILKERCERMNEWLCSTARQYPGRFAALIGIDPLWGSEWMVKEIETRFEQGAKGIKIIPDWGAYYPNNPVMWPAYKKLEELGMVFLSHSGAETVLGATVEKIDYSFPKCFEAVLRDFPRLNVVLAHLGWRSSVETKFATEVTNQQKELSKRYSNVYFDISCSFEEGLDKADEDLIREIGVDRVLWASDWHAHRAILGLESLKRSRFSEEEKRKILGENAQRIVKI